MFTIFREKKKKRLPTAIFLVFTICLIALASCGGENGVKKNEKKNAKDLSSVVAVRADAKITGEDFNDLFKAEIKFFKNDTGSEAEAEKAKKGLYLKVVNVYAFNERGKFDKAGRFGLILVPDGSTLCFTDFKKKISYLVAYDSIRNWNGNEARIYPMKVTLCDDALQDKKQTFNQNTGFIHEDRKLKLTTEPKGDTFLTEVAKEITDSGIDKVIASNFIGGKDINANK